MQETIGESYTNNDINDVQNEDNDVVFRLSRIQSIAYNNLSNSDNILKLLNEQTSLLRDIRRYVSLFYILAVIGLIVGGIALIGSNIIR